MTPKSDAEARDMTRHPKRITTLAVWPAEMSRTPFLRHGRMAVSKKKTHPAARKLSTTHMAVSRRANPASQT